MKATQLLSTNEWTQKMCDILFTILVSIIGCSIYLTFHTNEVLFSLKKE